MITDEKDISEILAGVRQLYEKAPLLIRPMIPPLPNILRQIPPCAMKYTLGELVELLENAHAQGLL